MAVRLAPVVEARDRLLADVAALAEADGALVDPGLLRDRLGRHLAPEPRPAGLHPGDLGGGGVDRARRRPRRGAAERRRRPRGGRSGRGRGRLRPRAPRRRRSDTSRWACSDRSGPMPVSAAAAGPITESTAWLVGEVLELDLAARRDRAPGGRRARPARPARSRAGARPGRPEHAQVGLHLALAVEQGGVAALPGLERRDVVGELVVHVLGRVRAVRHEAAGARPARACPPPRGGRGTGHRARPCVTAPILGRRRCRRLFDVSKSWLWTTERPRRIARCG